jgi:hypothetical protein
MRGEGDGGQQQDEGVGEEKDLWQTPCGSCRFLIGLDRPNQ